MKLKRTCREVTHLVLQAQDRPLALSDRLALRLHWMMCHACSRFRDQNKAMGVMMDRWRSYRDTD